MMHNEKINQLISDLPNDAETPSLTKFLSDLPIMTIGANGKWTKPNFMT
jgi:HAE1 family hydrophobic/amphiphilic exporter-1